MTSLSPASASVPHLTLDMPAPGRAGVASRRVSRHAPVSTTRNLVGAQALLAARYPVVRRLVGDAFFRDMSLRYIAAQPPHPPIMLYDETFPDFIDGFEPVRAVPYLPAVARIEMARVLAVHAPNSAAINAKEFAALPLRHLAELQVALHPSITVVASPYPVWSIWNVNQSRAPAIPVSPWAAEAALIARPRHRVEVKKLRAGEATFLQSLMRGDTLSEAVEAAHADAQEFDITLGVGLLIARQLVVGFGRRMRPAAFAN